MATHSNILAWRIPWTEEAGRLLSTVSQHLGFPCGISGKESAWQYRRHKRWRLGPWVGNIPWRRKWQPTPVLLPKENPVDAGTWCAVVRGVRVRYDWLTEHTQLCSSQYLWCYFNVGSNLNSHWYCLKSSTWNQWNAIHTVTKKHLIQGCMHWPEGLSQIIEWDQMRSLWEKVSIVGTLWAYGNYWMDGWIGEYGIVERV